MEEQIILGIDVGATGIKGGLVDIRKGELVTERKRLETPEPATPEAMGRTFAELVAQFDYEGPIGVGFPAIIDANGVALSAANIDSSWIGQSVAAVFSKATGGRKVVVLNDADAAGLTAMRFGSGKGIRGTVLMITIGTGLGSALFHNGHLIPNSEFGHIYLKGREVVAEKFISNSVRKQENLSWEEFGTRLNIYLHHLDRIISPDLVVLSGGASKNFDQYKDQLDTRIPVKPAITLNQAGTIGAAVFAMRSWD